MSCNTIDSTTDGRPVKIVSIVDEHTRECLGGLVERSITSDRLIDELDRLAQDRGYPAVLHCDNGPELTCAAMADWTSERVGLSFIPPGEPWHRVRSRTRGVCGGGVAAPGALLPATAAGASCG